MAIIFSVLVFILLFAIVIVNTTSEKANQEENNRSRSVRAAFACTLNPTNCEIECFEENNITAGVEEAISGNNVCASSGYSLFLQMTQFSNKKISSGWFSSSAIINLIYINSDGDDIIEIEPGAFDDCTFRSVLSFELRATAITELREGVFNGFNNLKSLYLNSNKAMRSIDENALEPLFQLEQLRMERQENVNPEFLKNFIGHLELKHMHTLKLANNNFSRIINSETFIGCTGVVKLDLSRSKIEAIGPRSFDPMNEKITELNLSGNYLTHLPSNLLTNMMKPYIQFYLSNNSWHCDCDSRELQGIAINNVSLIMDAPLSCEMPENEKGNLIRNVSLSECNTTTTSSFTTSPDVTENVTETVTEPPPPPLNLDPLYCDDHTARYAPNFIELEKTYQSFQVEQMDLGKVSIELSYFDPTLAMLLINNTVNGTRCQYNLEKKMIFDDLNPQSAHLFCLINKSVHATSPRNCVPFRFNETKSVWGSDEVIIVLVCSIVLALVLGILIGWLLSCRYQRCFKSKESLKYQSSGSSISKTSTEEFVGSMSLIHN